jgi:UrcA family protein
MFKSLNSPGAALALGFGLGLVSSAFARAESTSDINSPTMRLPYTLAEVQTSNGAHRLASRIQHAASSVCREDDPFMQSSLGFERCRSATIRRANAELKAPMVAEALGLAPVSVAQAAR